MFPPIFALSETVQLAIINNFVPIVTVLISAGGAIVSWMGWKKAQSNSHGIAAMQEVVQTTSSETRDAAVEAKKAVEETKDKLDDKLADAIQHAVEAATTQMQMKHDKEMADMKTQIAEARLTGERRKVL